MVCARAEGFWYLYYSIKTIDQSLTPSMARHESRTEAGTSSAAEEAGQDRPSSAEQDRRTVGRTDGYGQQRRDQRTAGGRSQRNPLTREGKCYAQRQSSKAQSNSRLLHRDNLDSP